MSDCLSENVAVVCADGYALVGTKYQAERELKGAVLIGPATGIKRQFYSRFAHYLAENGYGVLTYDNRGIGASLQGSIRASTATLQSWGELDQVAALKQLVSEFPNTRYHLLGHSAGGQLFGLLPNASQLTSIFNYACSSGCLRSMSFLDQLKAHFFMNVFIPASNLLLGYTPSQWVGMGVPLPKAVASQWRAWCNGNGYVKMAFDKTVKQHYFNELTTPSFWVNATDDPIANNLNVDDMLAVCPKITAKRLTLNPKEYDLKEIGHMKFFSRGCRSLWHLPVDWFDQFADG